MVRKCLDFAKKSLRKEVEEDDTAFEMHLNVNLDKWLDSKFSSTTFLLKEKILNSWIQQAWTRVFVMKTLSFFFFSHEY